LIVNYGRQSMAYGVKVSRQSGSSHKLTKRPMMLGTWDCRRYFRWYQHRPLSALMECLDPLQGVVLCLGLPNVFWYPWLAARYIVPCLPLLILIENVIRMVTVPEFR